MAEQNDLISEDDPQLPPPVEDELKDRKFADLTQFPKPLPMPDMEEFRKSLPKLRTQKLNTVMTEEGVELDPVSLIGKPIRETIGRVWSTLWGWTGSVKRLLKCDNRGNLIVRPFVWPIGTLTTDTTVCAGNALSMYSWGMWYDHIQITCKGAAFFATFKNEKGDYDNYGFSSKGYYDGTDYWFHLNMFVRCKQFKVQGLGGVGNVTYTLAAKVLSGSV